MDSWMNLIGILILLAAALFVGTLAQQLRQSPIIGYIIAGMIVGPHVLGWAGAIEDTHIITELGAALLLFAIGLEFSFQRLARLGSMTAVVGVLQILVTMAIATAITAMLGLDFRAALVIGFAIALSSTASVFRLLIDNALMDSPHGRVSTGVLLIQDIAVVPLVLITTALTGTGTTQEIFIHLGRTLVVSILAFAVMFVVLNHVVPRLLRIDTWKKDREMPILLAVIIAFGSAIAAHSAGISPAFGAFLAGMLLAESPFAVQIRSDISSIRAVMVTLFFAAIGMFGDPKWIASNLLVVIATTLAVVLLKFIVITVIMRILRYRPGVAVPSGLCLAQIGEFSFVIISIAVTAGLLSEDLFMLVISATVVALLVTPFLVTGSSRVSIWVDSLFSKDKVKKSETDDRDERLREFAPKKHDVIIIGLGPAGIKAIEMLCDKHQKEILAIDVNPKNAKAVKNFNVDFMIGDAKSIDVLEHAHLHAAEVVVITLPDPETVQQVVKVCREISSDIRIISRVRYDRYKQDILDAGANTIVNEEEWVGIQLANETCEIIE